MVIQSLRKEIDERVPYVEPQGDSIEMGFSYEWSNRGRSQAWSRKKAEGKDATGAERARRK